MRILKDEHMPARISIGDEVNLLKLHTVLDNMGDFNKVTKEDKWEIVAVKFGHDNRDAESLKLTHIKYLDLFEWYFHVMKDKVKLSKKERKGNSGMCRS
ncbi:putative transcription factor & chromatin remodeling ARID family [Helianthus anomalus]